MAVVAQTSYFVSASYFDILLLYEQANNELDKLPNWLRLNKLSINVNLKSLFIFFSKKKTKQE